VSYTYNAAGRVSKVEGASGTESKTYAENFTYHPHGAWKSMTLGNAALRQSREYNNRLQPTELKAEDLSPVVSTLMNFSYGFNWGAANNGNLLFANDYAQGISYAYTYDERNRIKTATANGPTCWGLNYGYDIWANLLSATVTQCSAVPLSLTVNTKNQITNPGIYYDAAGNFTNGISVLLTYDAENRIAGAGTSTYVYSPAGRRVKRTVSGATTLYMNDGPGGPALSEFNYTGIGQGSWIKDYIYLNGQLLATESATQGTRYHFSDHLGTPRVITNSDATWIARHDYYPFGREVGVSTDGETHKFTGKERDVETGLYNFGARYYHETHGRFMTPDTGVDQHPEDPQSWNLYAYARNNPLLLVDPTGEYVCGSSMSKDQCDTFQKGLDKAQEAANAAKDKYGTDSEQYKNAQRAIDAYGKAGVDNGVTIEVGNTGKFAAVTTVDGAAGAKTADNPTGQKIEVKFNPNALGNAMDQAHEGSHVADGSAWVASGFSRAFNPTRFQTEMDAYRVSATIGEGLGNLVSTVAFKANRYILAVRNWDPKNTDTAITNILRREYKLRPNSAVRTFQKNTKGAR
jgi:RHS repeat-associated protein